MTKQSKLDDLDEFIESVLAQQRLIEKIYEQSKYDRITGDKE